jgi:hypothetical protein
MSEGVSVDYSGSGVKRAGGDGNGLEGAGEMQAAGLRPWGWKNRMWFTPNDAIMRQRFDLFERE